MRTLVPADTLVYLETNDLGAALQPIVDSKPFNEVAKRKPDLSALNGVQMAVAVTGFETKEEKLTDEHSVGRIQPHFVAIADTHAWQFQTVRFAEQKLGGFVEKIYDSEPTLEKREKGGGHYLTWTAKDGRKAYAFVNRSLIYFGNDEPAIDKCLAVARGEADSIAKGSKVAASDPGVLASGYVSTDGIAQIANIFALKFAHDASDDSDIQSAVAGLMPQLLRNTITDVSWTARQSQEHYEDRWQVNMPSEVAGVFNETIVAGGEVPEPLLSKLIDPKSATRYNLRNPQVAWRSLLLVVQKQAGTTAAKILGELSGLLFEPFGIRDGETFLSSVDANIITGQTGLDVEGPFAVVTTHDVAKVKGTFLLGFRPVDEHIWRNDEENQEALISDNRIIIGSKSALTLLVDSGGDPRTTDLLDRLRKSNAPVTTGGYDNSIASPIVEMLSEKRSDEIEAGSNYFAETRFTKNGMDRKTDSDLGFIGWIIAQLNED